MKRGKKLFWGILFILGALALIVGKLGYLEGFGFWTILFTICLLGLLIDGIFRRGFGTILFSLAFLAILYDELLGIEAITPWPVLGAALLGTIGLGIIFPKKGAREAFLGKGHIYKKTVKSDSYKFQESMDGEHVAFDCSFGQAVKYVTSKSLSRGEMECAFGSLEVYLDGASLKEGKADIYVECSFGSIVLYVPEDWKVVVNTSAVFGGVEEKGSCNPMGTDILQIQGEVAFGALEIRYV